MSRPAPTSAPATVPASFAVRPLGALRARSPSATARPAPATSSPAPWASRGPPPRRSSSPSRAPTCAGASAAASPSSAPCPKSSSGTARGPCTPAAGDRPRSSPPSAAPCRSAGCFCEPRDPEAKGIVERHQGHLETNFEPGRHFASPEHFQAELDAWEERVAGRLLRTIRARPAERLANERESMRALPEAMPETDRRFVIRVPPQPYLRWDTNDYSLDPRVAGRRVEVRISQRQISAIALDTGELIARHPRSFAKGLTFTDPAHQAGLDQLRGDRRRGPQVEVELRPLERYDALIPA